MDKYLLDDLFPNLVICKIRNYLPECYLYTYTNQRFYEYVFTKKRKFYFSEDIIDIINQNLNNLSKHQTFIKSYIWDQNEIIRLQDDLKKNQNTSFKIVFKHKSNCLKCKNWEKNYLNYWVGGKLNQNAYCNKLGLTITFVVSINC